MTVTAVNTATELYALTLQYLSDFGYDPHKCRNKLYLYVKLANLEVLPPSDYPKLPLTAIKRKMRHIENVIRLSLR